MHFLTDITPIKKSPFAHHCSKNFLIYFITILHILFKTIFERLYNNLVKIISKTILKIELMVCKVFFNRDNTIT